MNLSISSSNQFFLIRLLVVLLCTICLFIAASEWLIRTHILIQDSYYLQGTMLNTQPSLTGLAVGDSHMSQDFLGTPEIWNAALPSENVIQMRKKIQYLLKKHPEISQVILQASPHMFSDYRYDLHGRRNYDTLWQVPSLYFFSDAYLRERIGWYWLTFLTNTQIEDQIHRSPYGGVTSVNTIHTPLTDKEKHDILERVAKQRISQPFRNSLMMREWLTLLDMLTSHGVFVCLVEFPAVAYHRTEIARNYPVFHEIREALKEIATARRLPFISYWDTFDDNSLYRNGDHLNLTGAEILTPRMIADCGIKSPHNHQENTENE